MSNSASTKWGPALKEILVYIPPSTGAASQPMIQTNDVHRCASFHTKSGGLDAVSNLEATHRRDTSASGKSTVTPVARHFSPGPNFFHRADGPHAMANARGPSAVHGY